MAGFPFSDGAILAINKAKDRIFRPDWKENVFDIANVKRSVDEITKG
jgi:D-apionate oxidoisomerase